MTMQMDDRYASALREALIDHVQTAPARRRRAIRRLALGVAAGLLLVVAAAAVGLSSQPKVIPANGGAVPDVECPIGVSPAQVFCYATSIPIPGAPKPSQFGVPQEPGASDMPYVGP